MGETAEDFPVHRFIQDLFEDLSLTLPSLGLRFEGLVTASTLIGRHRRTWLKNKLFLLFADLAVHASRSGMTRLDCRFTVSRAGNLQKWCFFCLPFPAEATGLTAWDADHFVVLKSEEGEGFSVLVEPGKPLDLGPPVHWQELSRLYGSRDDALQVVRQFVNRCGTLLPALEQNLATRDATEVLRLSHTLKGAARGVAAQGLSYAAHQLEMLGRSGDFSQAEELYKALLETYHEVTSWVEEGHP